MKSGFTEKYRKRFWGGFMIASYLSFSYYYFDGWWYSGLGTLLIVFFAFRIWPADFLTQTGLKISARKLMYSLILVVILSTGAYILMKSIASENGITIQYETFTNYIHDIFYTLNEEIVLGAVLLGIIRRKFTALHPAMISLLVAVIFMIFHYIFYRWIFTDSGILMVSTLTSLLFVGILRNNLILFTGHVGYAWAFHASWMAVMFGCNHLYTTDGQLLSELERFNLYLGSPKILPLIAILMLITLYSIIRKN